MEKLSWTLLIESHPAYLLRIQHSAALCVFPCNILLSRVIFLASFEESCKIWATEKGVSCVFNPLQLYALLKKQESPVLFRTGDSGARGGSRTRTSLRTLAPEASESTNSTTRASFMALNARHNIAQTGADVNPFFSVFFMMLPVDESSLPFCDCTGPTKGL